MQERYSYTGVLDPQFMIIKYSCLATMASTMLLIYLHNSVLMKNRDIWSMVQYYWTYKEMSVQ